MALPMDDKTNSVSCCLNPELLSKETLISILNEKGICPVDVEVMDKHQLVDFFYNHLIPLPQRLNCQSKRWKRLYDKYLKKETQKRTLESNESSNGNRKKTKISTSDSTERLNEMKMTTKRTNFLVKSNEKPTSNLNCKVRKLNLNETNQSEESEQESKQKHQRITWP